MKSLDFLDALKSHPVNKVTPRFVFSCWMCLLMVLTGLGDSELLHGSTWGNLARTISQHLSEVLSGAHSHRQPVNPFAFLYSVYGLGAVVPVKPKRSYLSMLHDEGRPGISVVHITSWNEGLASKHESCFDKPMDPIPFQLGSAPGIPRQTWEFQPSSHQTMEM